jgi:hypothetical protein
MNYTSKKTETKTTRTTPKGVTETETRTTETNISLLPEYNFEWLISIYNSLKPVLIPSIIAIAASMKSMFGF